VAVTVEQAPFVVLDEKYRIVEVGAAAQGGFGPLVGQVVWDCFLDSKPLFEPYYERAKRLEEPVEFTQFYDGQVVRIRAIPDGDRVIVFWEPVLRIDALTLERLQSSIAEAVAVLDDRPRATRDALTVIQGGGA